MLVRLLRRGNNGFKSRDIVPAAIQDSTSSAVGLSKSEMIHFFKRETINYEIFASRRHLLPIKIKSNRTHSTAQRQHWTWKSILFRAVSAPRDKTLSRQSSWKQLQHFKNHQLPKLIFAKNQRKHWKYLWRKFDQSKNEATCGCAYFSMHLERDCGNRWYRLFIPSLW